MDIQKSYTWSYSSLSLYKQCPHKFYRLKVVKDIKEPPSPVLSYGLAVHKAAEEHIRDGKPIPEKYAYMQSVLDSLKGLDGTKLCEIELGLTKDLKPCGFSAAGVWWRGVADLVVVQDSRMYLIDYKTSKSARYADDKQLEVLALGLFKRFPMVDKIKGALVFVVSNEIVRKTFDREDEVDLWPKWLADTKRLEQAHITDVWNPKPNFTCAKYCPVVDCLHNGRLM